MTKINRMLFKLEGFQYAKSLGFNLGYDQILLTEDSRNLCMIILPWVKYRYKYLTTGAINSPEN